MIHKSIQTLQIFSTSFSLRQQYLIILRIIWRKNKLLIIYSYYLEKLSITPNLRNHPSQVKSQTTSNSLCELVTIGDTASSPKAMVDTDKSAL